MRARNTATSVVAPGALIIKRVATSCGFRARTLPRPCSSPVPEGDHRPPNQGVGRPKALDANTHVVVCDHAQQTDEARRELTGKEVGQKLRTRRSTT